MLQQIREKFTGLFALILLGMLGISFVFFGIGNFTFLGTGSILCGHVTTGESAFIGGGATIKPGTRVGARTTIGTGAVLIRDADPDSVYIGNPARKLEKN